MIVQFPAGTRLYKIDIGRPSFYSDDDCAWWRKFFEFVETTPTKVHVNPVYSSMRECAYNNGRYGGGGFGFCFFFESVDDRKCFVADYNAGVADENKYQDFRNLGLVFHQDEKTVDLWFHEKFLERATEYNNINDSCLTITQENYRYVASGSLKQVGFLKNILNEYSLEIDDAETI